MHMNVFDQDDFAQLYYRKNKLRDAAVGIMELVSGTGLSICPYMQDENGRYSEERTLATVEEMMEALKTYLRFELAEEDGPPIGKDENRHDVYAYRYYEMSEEEINCYRGFVYCALRHIYANYDYLAYGEGPFRRVFGDLIELATDQNPFRSYELFLHDRYMKRFACEEGYYQDLLPWDVPLSDDSTEWFAEACEMLAPRKKAERTEDPTPQSEADASYLPYEEEAQHRAFQRRYMATDEEMERLLRGLTKEQKEKVARRLQAYEEIQKYVEGYYESEEAACCDESDEELDALIREEERERVEKFAEEFAHFESFQAHLNLYLHFQHLRYHPNRFLDAVTGMVDFFLLAQGKSCFADPQLFYRMFAQMQRMTQQTEVLLRGNKR